VSVLHHFQEFSGLCTLSSGVKENERNTFPGPLDGRFNLRSTPLAGLLCPWKRVYIAAKHRAVFVFGHKVSAWVTVFKFHLLAAAQEHRFSFSLNERGLVAL
jgi:hypothetical protein